MARYDLKPLMRGTARTIKVLITKDGSVVDISSDTLTMTVKARKNDTDANKLFSVAGDVSTSGANGVGYLSVTGAQSALCREGKYYYDVIWTDATDSEDYEVSWGYLDIIERVSDV